MAIRRAWRGGQALLEVAVITGLVALGALVAIGHHWSGHRVDPLGVMGRRLEGEISVPVERAECQGQAGRGDGCSAGAAGGSGGEGPPREARLRVKRRLGADPAAEPGSWR